ncbi:MAG: arabinosidase, partial [Candidatus Hinthialibacter sp.]
LCLRTAFASSPFGPFQNISAPFTESYSEGPSAIKIGDEWFIYFDRYHDHKYGAVKTRDFETWEDISDKLFFPKDHRHGTIFKAPRRVLTSLQQ